MTISVGDLARVRGRQWQHTRLCVYHPTTLLAAQVDGNPAAGATSLTLKNMVGSTPFADALLYFGSVAGAHDLGIGRFKSLTGSTLKLASNVFDLADGAYATVLNEIKPVFKLSKQQANSLTSEDDDSQYSGQNHEFKPLALLGPPAVAWRDPLTGLATVSYWSSSFAFTAGAHLTNWNWFFPGGTPATASSAGSAGSPLSVTYATPGDYYTKLNVVDSNGKTATGYRPTLIDPPTYQFEYTGAPQADAYGWSVKLKVHGAAGEAAFPEQALILLVADQYWNGQLLNLGGDYVGRENLLFCGYARSGSIVRNWQDQTVEFEAEGIGKVLDNLTGVASNHKSVAGTPSNWHEFNGLTARQIVYHLLTEHCTLAAICDLVI